MRPPSSRRWTKGRSKSGRTRAKRLTERHQPLSVETVGWDEAREFCRKLSAMPVERAARRVYRLPTEAEWEYACRAGTTTRWYSGDDEAGLVDVAWFNTQTRARCRIRRPQKRPNAWGPI